ncbi:MAG: hypothetical protein ACKVOR_09725 [Flavobacteriales bacterium]
MKNRKQFLSTATAMVLGLMCCTTMLHAQSAFILPSPTAVDDSVTIYIDINQTNGGLKTMLINHPDEQANVHIWTWNPADNGGNGSWGDSNEERLMTHEGNLIYSFKIVPATFYVVDGPTFFSKGISCLAKLDNGNAYPDDGVGEAKTEDFNIPIIPKLCDDLYCPFPQLGKTEDFLTITYDNNQETHPDMQAIGPDDCYLFIRADYDEFNFGGVNYVEAVNVTSTPALKMTYIGDGFFRLTILPDDMFASLIGINTIHHLRFYALRTGFTYPGVPPYEEYTFMTCE